jgi:hypothetical protein
MSRRGSTIDHNALQAGEAPILRWCALRCGNHWRHPD